MVYDTLHNLISDMEVITGLSISLLQFVMQLFQVLIFLSGNQFFDIVLPDIFNTSYCKRVDPFSGSHVSRGLLRTVPFSLSSQYLEFIVSNLFTRNFSS